MNRVLYMNTYVHLWQYLAEFFVEWEMFQTKLQIKSEYTFYNAISFLPQESFRLWNNVKK